MSNAGIFFALTALELAGLEGRVSIGEQRTWVNETYLERSAESSARMLDVDVAWDAIHRCLGDGTLDEDPTHYPLRRVVLGGAVVKADKGLIMRLNAPEVIRDLAPRLAKLDESGFRVCYFAIRADSYVMEPNEMDFQYTWDYFQQLKPFYERAVEQNNAVLFIAYQ